MLASHCLTATQCCWKETHRSEQKPCWGSACDTTELSATHSQSICNTDLAKSLQISLPSISASRAPETSAEGEVRQKQVLFQIHTESLQRVCDTYSTAHLHSKAPHSNRCLCPKLREGSMWHKEHLQELHRGLLTQQLSLTSAAKLHKRTTN